MPEWSDDEIVLVSAIEHYSYCPRQCALIHVDKVFDENVFTMRGRRAHERVDQPEISTEEGVRVERGVPLWSERLGLQGKSDVIEFRADGSVYPVEYKFGKRRAKIHDDLQLCAQALCLEEMLGRVVERGAIYYYSSRRRREVVFDSGLREATERIIPAVRGLLVSAVMPPPVNDARCPNCSLIDVCMPSALAALTEDGTHERLFVPIAQEDVT